MKYILSFLELDDSIEKIVSNQTEILNHLKNLQDSQINNQDLLNKDININQSLDSNFKNIIYFTIGTILIIGIIYYFTSGGGNGDSINTLFSNLNDKILQQINTNNNIVDNNMKYILDILRRDDDHLVDVINNLLIQNHEKINKIVSLRIFNAILKNGRHLEDITKILENSNLTSNIENVATHNFKKVIFSDES